MNYMPWNYYVYIIKHRITAMPSGLSRGRNTEVVTEIDWDFKLILKNQVTASDQGFESENTLLSDIPIPHFERALRSCSELRKTLHWRLKSTSVELTKQRLCDHWTKVLPEWAQFKGVYLAEIHTNKRERESRHDDFPAVRSSTELQNDYLPKAEHMNTTKLLAFLHGMTKPNDPLVLLLYTVIFPINSVNFFLLIP